MKLGSAQLPKAIESLGAAIAQIETGTENEPVFRLVVTGTGPVLVADDGTITAPLHALAPRPGEPANVCDIAWCSAKLAACPRNRRNR